MSRFLLEKNIDKEDFSKFMVWYIPDGKVLFINRQDNMGVRKKNKECFSFGCIL